MTGLASAIFHPSRSAVASRGSHSQTVNVRPGAGSTQRRILDGPMKPSRRANAGVELAGHDDGSVGGRRDLQACGTHYGVCKASLSQRLSGDSLVVVPQT